MKKQANLSCVMLVQQLEPEFWIGWDDATIEEAHNGNIRPLIKELVKRFEKDGCEVTEAYGILHDKDLISVWNQDEMKKVEELKAKHVHILIKFGKGDTLNSLAVKAGVAPQYLEKAKSGRYGYDNLLSYLVHAKDQDKYQYSTYEVVTVSGEDYTSVYNRRMETWVRGRATKEAQATDLSVDYLVSEVLAGKLTKSQVLLTNEFYKVYALHKRKINDAFDTAGESKSYQTIADLDAGKFKKTILFIMAESGAGKTVLSKQIISILQSVALKQTEHRWDYCLTASNNAFDEYNGQDILFLDDIRGDSLSVSDWLKLLDPYTISPISARYHNKMGAAKVIIITSTKTPSEFFSIAKGNFHEDLGQFFRRIDLLINIEDNKLHLSKPEKAPPASTQFSYVMKPPSHYFRFDGTHYKNKALDKVTKVVIRNMQWNKKKPVTQPAKANMTDSFKK
ncbi:Rep family protein [Enterococcus faecalis]|uniref:Rep family protein n=1 Tax=Enterococcus faecalis TaxID=1351 RepID=UPI002542C635|nr:Rep family protein [Enterococcus faecalis]MDK4410059.1 Rep family protein [Enterococcus faecalis]MEB5892137.1 Rep family protein [Enterococcus faecalis]